MLNSGSFRSGSKNILGTCEAILTRLDESKRVSFLTLNTYRRAGFRIGIQTGLRMDDAAKLLSISAGNRTCHLSGFTQCSAHSSYASGLSSDRSSPPTNTSSLSVSLPTLPMVSESTAKPARAAAQLTCLWPSIRSERNDRAACTTHFYSAFYSARISTARKRTGSL